MNRTERVVILALVSILFVLLAVRYFQDSARRVDVQVIHDSKQR